MKDAKLVYSTDPKLNEKCPQCRELKVECVCLKEAAIVINQLTFVLRIEKNGRGGKIVTVIDKIPANDNFLKDLTSELKKKCGTGGTYKLQSPHSQIEIQGDKLEAIKKVLLAKGIKFKG